jgi:ribosomal protein S1
MKRTVAVFALALAFSAIAFAHGNEKHVMGTVTSISDNSITVETTSKKTVMVTLSTATKFQKSGSPAALKDLKVGDKVVIHATGAEEKLVATEVRFGTMSKDNMSGMKGMDHSHPSDAVPEPH